MLRKTRGLSQEEVAKIGGARLGADSFIFNRDVVVQHRLIFPSSNTAANCALIVKVIDYGIVGLKFINTGRD